MTIKQRLVGICVISIILLLIVQECDAIKSSGSRKTSSGRKTSGSNTGSSSSGGSWWSKVTGGSSSSASKASSSSATQKKPPPQPSAPQQEHSKPIGWNVPGVNNPGAPPAYSNTHTRGLSNTGSLSNPPPYSKNSPPGHQTIHANTANQYQGASYPRQPGAGQYPGGSPPNQGGHYPGVNYAGQGGGHYPGVNYAGQGGGHYPGVNYGGQSGGHYPGMNYGAGGHSGYSGYPGHSGYSAAAPSGYFASGYPAVNNYYGTQQRSSSGNTLTNTLLAGSLGLGLYNAIRPYPSYSGGYGGGGGLAGGGSTVHHHYYNNQAQGASPNQNPDQAMPSNQNTNAVQPAVASVPQGPGVPVPQGPGAPIPQGTVAQNGSVDATAALVTPPPPTLAPDNQITDLDCVYAMKILNCSEIPLCPQEWMHPSCLNRTISKEYYDSITLPPPPPIPQVQPEANPTLAEKANDQMNASQNQNVYSSNNQQQPVVQPSSSSSAVDYSLSLTVFLAVTSLLNKF